MEYSGHCPDVAGSDGGKCAALEMFQDRGQIAPLATGIHVAYGCFLERPDRRFAIGMTFPQLCFVERAEFLGLGLVACFKALSNALSGNGAGGVVDFVAEFWRELGQLSASLNRAMCSG